MREGRCGVRRRRALTAPGARGLARRRGLRLAITSHSRQSRHWDRRKGSETDPFCHARRRGRSEIDVFPPHPSPCPGRGEGGGKGEGVAGGPRGSHTANAPARSVPAVPPPGRRGRGGAVSRVAGRKGKGRPRPHPQFLKGGAPAPTRSSGVDGAGASGSPPPSPSPTPWPNKHCRNFSPPIVLPLRHPPDWPAPPLRVNHENTIMSDNADAARPAGPFLAPRARGLSPRQFPITRSSSP